MSRSDFLGVLLQALAFNSASETALTANGLESAIREVFLVRGRIEVELLLLCGLLPSLEEAEDSDECELNLEIID